MPTYETNILTEKDFDTYDEYQVYLYFNNDIKVNIKKIPAK